MANDRQERAARAEQMRKEREKADRKQRNLITVGIVVVVVALIALAGFGYQSMKKDKEIATELTTPQNVNKDYGILYTPEVATGKAPASDADPVKVTLYEDFLCPGCGALEQTAGSFLSDQVAAGEIQIEYRPYAFLVNQSTNEYSQRAWNAAACVNDKGGPKAFKAFHDILFANQPQEGGAGPENSQLIEWAKEAGVTGVDACINKQTFTPWIEDALSQGKDDGVSGTPTMRIDGKDVSGEGNTIPQQADIQKAIDAAKKA
ncbi:DsbA family protein [Aeromicrobium stalagmiti]|uniref:DsbA family protein n=1 Tax=Aeromicrobium stalagmiti TaxID=2738988 RepID=UPI00156A38B6|nr:thioredoxin domain-containing protein [Aeromicrobium stalagmiti]NRQ51134.1 thioredoxin domain-containing protein [Aeromicrobium stalagmiti]